jgi:23S rRNA pseudouridine955/2504/2580 synthase
MTGVQTIIIVDDEADLRLDRWFRRHFPQVTQGRLQKLLRSGQIRIDGKRADAGDRLLSGQAVRVPPLPVAPPAEAARPVDPRDAKEMLGLVIYRDDAVLAINKPPGLAVQGGTGTHRHLDAMLDALRFDAPERPRLVHRLDRDTSGVLLLARSAKSATALARAFQTKQVQKLYWAVVAGVPKPARGTIDLGLAKRAGQGGREHVVHDEEAGQRAVTSYQIVDAASPRAAWLTLLPLTGRTHQLRVHCAALGTPVLGDGKYGGAAAFLPGSGIPRQLQLHARRLRLPHPAGGTLDVTADLPPHMLETFRYFGFEPGHAKQFDLDSFPSG